MPEPDVEFRKIRDFGENLNDTLLFIRQNLKPLVRSFFAISSIFLLGQAIFSGLYASRVLQRFKPFESGDSIPAFYGSIFTSDYLLTVLFGWAAYTAMKLSLGAYIKYYTENNGARPGIDDIWKIFKQYFLIVFVSSIPLLLLITAGLFFCIVPGVYLAIVFMPFDMVLMIENASFRQAWIRCFTLIRDNFWVSFVIYLVAGLIYGTCLVVVRLVVSLLSTVFELFSSGNNPEITTIITNVLHVVASVFYIVFFVSMAMQYFNLVERADGTGLMGRISSIGNDAGDSGKPEEQY